MRLATTFMITLLAAMPALAQPMPGMGGHPAPAGDAPMMDSMKKMSDAMASAPMTGDADHDFVVMMIPHHQGAIDMANFELQHGHDPELRKLAHEIIAAQDKEIGFMKRWLAKHPAK